MISKELLSEVLGIPISKEVGEYGLTGTIKVEVSNFDGAIDLSFRVDSGESSVPMYINIHELAHECKKWAFKEGYVVAEFIYVVELYMGGALYEKFNDKTTNAYDPDRVIKACQYILYNKDNT